MVCANTAPVLQLPITNNSVTADGNSLVRGVEFGLGNPQQVLSFVPALAESDLWVFNSADCSSSSNDSCIAEKGGVFDPSASSTYQKTIESQWNGSMETWLQGGYIYFNDELRYGTNGSSLGFPALIDEPSYSSEAGLPLGPNSTFVKAAYESGNAPSKVWGLWPGTRNIYDPVDGLLVIGGYDTTRVNGNFVTFDTCVENLACVYVDQFSYVSETGTTTSLLANSSETVAALLETFTRGLLLPQAIWDKFAAASLGTYDPDLELLTYNVSNPPTGSISVTLSNGYQTTIPSTEIFSKPRGYNSEGVYSIDNDTVIISIISNTTEVDDVMKLGMPYMTMNYLLMDYDNKQFKMAPSNREASDTLGSPVISTVCGAALTTSTSTSSATSTTTSTSGGGSNHIGAIVGGVVGGVGGLALILCLVGFLFWRRSRKTKAVAAAAAQETKPGIYSQNDCPAKPELADNRVSLLTSSAAPPTEYSELASPYQRASEFSHDSQEGSSQVHSWLHDQGTIHEEESKPFISATSGPVNDPVEMPTERD